MKHKRSAIRLLSFIFALVLTVGLLPISVFATENNYTDYDLCEALDAYKRFTEEEYHEDEWNYTIKSFGLYDLNHDGVPELFTLGGGQMDYSKVFTYKNKQVDLVHWGSGFDIYDNGIVHVGFSSGFGYTLHSYYTVGNDLSLKLAFRFAEWKKDWTYSIGEQAYDENSEKVSYQQVAEQREKIIGNAQIVNIVYHDNTVSERNAVFTNGNKAVAMQRLYHPITQEHFYTKSEHEKNVLVSRGWKYEGIGWYAPTNSNTPVYRLYNPFVNDHHYTTSSYEREVLIKKQGWIDEGIGWYSDDNKSVPLYRRYCPLLKSGSHHYTPALNEAQHLVKVGWKDEGIAWYGLNPDKK